MIPVSEIADKLASPIHVKHLLITLREKNINNVQDLNKLSEADIVALPVKEPKVVTVKNLLKLLQVFF